MENAADALKIAAAILIFIIAIASSFSLFGTAKQTADSIIGMRDKQKYLEAAGLDNGILYTSSSEIQAGGVAGVTPNGDRIVEIDDVISTIYRYTKEKYGVTIVEEDTGTVLARFDSSTESIMNQYDNILPDSLVTYEKILEENTKTRYAEPKFQGKLKTLYKVGRKVGAPWYGSDNEIQKRINADIAGEKYSYNGKTYEGKNLLKLLKGKRIIEVTNEIDQSQYLEDNDQTTNLLQQYQMPTVEIIYIISKK